jgi:hypothetical protein
LNLYDDTVENDDYSMNSDIGGDENKRLSKK